MSDSRGHLRWARWGKVLAHAAVGVGLAAILGCGQAMPSATPDQAATQLPLTAEQIADAVRFRASVGLRSDVGWILQVAADPSSRSGTDAYGTPLTLIEKAELDARAQNATAVSSAVERYGAKHSAEWGGSFIDARSGVFVALFTSNLDGHEAAIRSLVSPKARFEVRAARFSLAELESYRRLIEANQDWLRTIDAWYAGTGLDIRANRLVLDISSANPRAADLTVERFQGDDWLLVRSDGIGRWEGPLGTAVIHAKTPSGEPAQWLDCVLTPDDPAAAVTEAYRTGQNGTCRVERIGATGYNVELKALRADGSAWDVVGRGRLIVRPEQIASITIEVELP